MTYQTILNMIFYFVVGLVFARKAYSYAFRQDYDIYKEKFNEITIMSIICMVADFISFYTFGAPLFLLHMLPVLQVQRYSDVKTKQVYVQLNKALVGISCFDAFVFMPQQSIFSRLIAISVIIAIFTILHYKAHQFGHGDYMVICSVAILTQLMPSTYDLWAFGVIYFLVFIIGAYISIYIAGHRYCRKNHLDSKTTTIAFYPYMEFGVLCTGIYALIYH